MTLNYLDFDYSEDTEGVGVFDAMATIGPQQVGAVHAEIEQLILQGELAIGQHVNESELALRFGTSRGPIREALRALEESGLVRSEKHRGVFVREISVAEADEIYDIREALDQLIGQRVAERATPQQLRSLEAVLAEMDEAVRMQDIKRYHGLNLKLTASFVKRYRCVALITALLWCWSKP